MGNELEVIEQIYEAIGDPDAWQRLRERLTSGQRPSSEIRRHLEIARQAHEQHLDLRHDIELLSGVHNQITVAAMVVDAERRVLRANAAATRLVEKGDSFMLASGPLRATDADDDALLQRAIARALAADAAPDRRESPFVLVKRTGRQPLVVVVMRTEVAILPFLGDRPTATLLMIDSEESGVPAIDVLRGLYGFTQREAEFAALLMRGLSIKETAGALGVTAATARTFLARVTAKTDSHSQPELMARLLAVPQISVSEEIAIDVGQKKVTQ